MRRAPSILLAILLLASGCSGDGDEGVPVREGANGSAGTSTVPTVSDLRTATFGPFDGVMVHLTGGKWQGDPYVGGGAERPAVTLVEAHYAAGDLDGDGVDEAVVPLLYTSGGTGGFRYLAVASRTPTGVRQRALTELGDRIQIRSLTIDAGRIRLETVEHGPEDPMCCPTLAAVHELRLDGGQLRPIEPEA